MTLVERHEDFKAIKRNFNTLADEIKEITSENNLLLKKLGDYDEKWLDETKLNQIKSKGDEKRNSIFSTFLGKMKKLSARS